MIPPLIEVDWRPCWRLVSSRFPPAGLFDRVADQEDLEIVLAIEGMTNDRLRDEAGEIALVAPEERVSGPGTTPIMAAFTHLNPEGSRFSNGTYGVYYAARDIDTAISETRYDTEHFLAATNEPPIEVDMRSYTSDLEAVLNDIRGMQATIPDIHSPNPTQCAAGQALAEKLRDEGANGIVYSSVRHPGGECVAVFRPRILSPVRQGAHYCYMWDGEKIADIYEKRAYTPHGRA